MFKKSDSIAILIDGENSNPRFLPSVIEAAEKLGKVKILRLYADFTSSLTTCWKQSCLEYNLEVRHQFALIKGKNTIDIEIVMDAMEIAFNHTVDAICIVSSDSDFRGVTLRIRKSGIKVYGFGNPMTNQYFRQACDKFFIVGESKDISPFLPNLKSILEAAKTDESGYILIEKVGDVIKKALPDFLFKDYGFKTTRNFFESRPDLFEVQVRQSGIFKRYYIRNKKPETKPVCVERPYERDIMA